MNYVKSILAAVAAVVFLAVGTSTYAVPTLFLSDGLGHTISIADASAQDSNPNANVVTWIGSLGAWNINVSTGLSTGTAGAPILDLSSVNATDATGGGTLQVWFSNNGFGPTASSPYSASIGGTTPGSVTYNTFADAGNALFGTSLALTSQTFGSSPFAGTQVASLSEVFPYSLSQEVIITQTGAGQTSYNASLGPVPDGGMTLVLLGSSLMALGCFGRGRKIARA